MRGEYYMQTWVDAGSPDGFVYTDEHEKRLCGVPVYLGLGLCPGCRV